MLARELRTTATTLRRAIAIRHRLELRLARTDKRAWVVKRRERTRQLIELGGLVAKAGLIELTGDDRAVLLGAMLDIASRLQGDEKDQALLLWRRRGKRAFEDDDNQRAIRAS